jgi:hypothetical protein
MAASFGKRAKRATPAPREPFDFTFLRDEVPETHNFQARARADMISMANTLTLAKKNPEDAMPSMLRLISKMIDNKDGTPLGWVPEVLSIEKPEPGPVGQAVLRQEWPTQGSIIESGQPATPDDEGDDVTTERKFRGPDGELYGFEHAEKFTAFEAGSSRRRWHQLMDVDDDIEVEAADLMELFEWLVGLAAGRPTRPSS